ncbi:terminase small subunit [Sporosarcina sp. ANT_H38]|uniref:terminase small subunit n=1 Tax=Sporosarcina sp. ANT_H38 TaxID=2597358 RepID=UPI0011F19343|nr:terminase small subunit [Sporosarcina sp. ANT_H38]KAA0941608.1 terminase small subunit [Sporosarcina sp. ANT_H38]
MSSWDEIKLEWETTKTTLAALAEKHGVKLGTLKSRKSREAWVRGPSKKDATKKQKDAKRMQPKEAIVESDDLTDKQRLFCIYYIKYFNATKAYQKAYECDYMTANANGSRLLVNASIRKEITRMKEERASGMLLSADMVLQKYIDIAFADIGDFVERSDGGYSIAVRPLDQMDTSIIGELSNTENGVKLKLVDKMKALDMLSKYFDVLSDNDKKRLQEEKLKADTAKAKAEVHRITNENKQVAPPTINIVDAWSDGE